jgi:hypothetical protein
LAKLKAVVDAHCPVLDILRAPLPVQLELAAAPSPPDRLPTDLQTRSLTALAALIDRGYNRRGVNPL